MVTGALVGLAAGAAAGAMGSKGGTQTSTTSQTNAPWTPQQPYLLSGLKDAQNAYNQVNNLGPYSGSYYSPINAQQTASANAATNWVGGQGAGLANGEANMASGLFSTAPQYSANASSLAANGIGPANSGLMGVLSSYASNPNAASLNSPLNTALNSAAISGANYIGTGQGNLLGISNSALADPTKQMIADASSYANSSPVQGQINATNSMIDQTLNDQTLPGVNRDAALSGNLNSSRAGMEEAMAKQAAANSKASADSGLFNSAYQQGLSTAAAQRDAGLNSAISANSSAMFPAAMSMNGTGQLMNNENQFNANSQKEAANSGLTQGLNYASQNANTELNANNQLGSAARLGLTGANSASNLAAANYSLGQGAGGLFQNNQNNILANNYAQWKMQSSFPYQNLDNYWNIVGKPLGTQSTGTRTSQTSTSPLAGAISGGLGGMSLGSGLGGGSLFGNAASGVGGLFGAGGGSNLSGVGITFG